MNPKLIFRKLTLIFNSYSIESAIFTFTVIYRATLISDKKARHSRISKFNFGRWTLISETTNLEINCKNPWYKFNLNFLNNHFACGLKMARVNESISVVWRYAVNNSLTVLRLITLNLLIVEHIFLFENSYLDCKYMRLILFLK